jgi:NADH-quinone oxidoreductase subunit A
MLPAEVSVQFEFAAAAVFLLIAFVIVGAALFLGRFLRPNNPDPIKGQTYECGEQPIGSGWFNFNPRFYQLALLFLIFDVEIALTLPVILVARRWIGEGNGALAVVEILLFLFILAAALAYVWGRGDLEWDRDVGVLADGEIPDDAPMAAPEKT